MSTIAAWPGRAENWLDDHGKGAWIAAMVLGFIIFWPVGLALLAYMIWSRRMFSNRCAQRSHKSRYEVRLHRHGFRSSGNSSFDAYKSDTLDRLEREQEDFEAFLKRLRDSKDKAEFDQYLDQRARAARDSGEGDEPEMPGPEAGNDAPGNRPSRGQY